MINVKKRKGRAYFQIPSNKVDCDKRTRLTFKNTANALKLSKKRDSIREAKNVNITSNNAEIEINFNFIYYESRAEVMGRRDKVSQGIQN
jgi:hypothetical protein